MKTILLTNPSLGNLKIELDSIEVNPEEKYISLSLHVSCSKAFYIEQVSKSRITYYRIFNGENVEYSGYFNALIIGEKTKYNKSNLKIILR